MEIICYRFYLRGTFDSKTVKKVFLIQLNWIPPPKKKFQSSFESIRVSWFHWFCIIYRTGSWNSMDVLFFLYMNQCNRKYLFSNNTIESSKISDCLFSNLIWKLVNRWNALTWFCLFSSCMLYNIRWIVQRIFSFIGFFVYPQKSSIANSRWVWFTLCYIILLLWFFKHSVCEISCL